MDKYGVPLLVKDGQRVDPLAHQSNKQPGEAGPQQLLFAISTGYCGTATMAMFLKTAQDTMCFHEQAPVDTGIRYVWEQGMGGSRGLRRMKVVEVLHDLERPPFRYDGKELAANSSYPPVLKEHPEDTRSTVLVSRRSRAWSQLVSPTGTLPGNPLQPLLRLQDGQPLNTSLVALTPLWTKEPAAPAKAESALLGQSPLLRSNQNVPLSADAAVQQTRFDVTWQRGEQIDVWKSYQEAHKAGEVGATVRYCETSHMFIKAWGDVALEEFVDNDQGFGEYHVQVLSLRRHFADVLRSAGTQGQGHFPLRSNTHYLHGMAGISGAQLATHATFSNMLTPQAYEYTDALDHTAGYIFDTWVKADRMVDRWGERASFVEVWIDDLNRLTTVDSMQRTLHLELTSEMERRWLAPLQKQKTVGSNRHALGKRIPGEYWQLRMWRYLAMLQHSGIGNVDEYSVPTTVLPHKVALSCRAKAAFDTGYNTTGWDAFLDASAPEDLPKAAPAGSADAIATLPIPEHATAHRLPRYAAWDSAEARGLCAAPSLTRPTATFRMRFTPAAGKSSIDFDTGIKKNRMPADCPLVRDSWPDQYDGFTCRYQQCMQAHMRHVLEPASVQQRIATLQPERLWCLRMDYGSAIPPRALGPLHAALMDQLEAGALEADAELKWDWKNPDEEVMKSQRVAAEVAFKAVAPLCEAVEALSPSGRPEQAELAALAALILPWSGLQGDDSVVVGILRGGGGLGMVRGIQGVCRDATRLGVLPPCMRTYTMPKAA